MCIFLANFSKHLDPLTCLAELVLAMINPSVCMGGGQNNNSDHLFVDHKGTGNSSGKEIHATEMSG